MLPGVQKKRGREREEKRIIVRVFLPYVFHLDFFFFISYSSLVYSLVAPSEKKKLKDNVLGSVFAGIISG